MTLFFLAMVVVLLAMLVGTIQNTDDAVTEMFGALILAAIGAVVLLFVAWLAVQVLWPLALVLFASLWSAVMTSFG